jgi:hypothetical protein
MNDLSRDADAAPGDGGASKEERRRGRDSSVVEMALLGSSTDSLDTGSIDTGAATGAGTGVGEGASLSTGVVEGASRSAGVDRVDTIRDTIGSVREGGVREGIMREGSMREGSMRTTHTGDVTGDGWQDSSRSGRQDSRGSSRGGSRGGSRADSRASPINPMLPPSVSMEPSPLQPELPALSLECIAVVVDPRVASAADMAATHRWLRYAAPADSTAVHVSPESPEQPSRLQQQQDRHEPLRGAGAISHALQSSSAAHPDEWHFLASGSADGSIEYYEGPNVGAQIGPLSFSALLRLYNGGSGIIVDETLCWVSAVYRVLHVRCIECCMCCVSSAACAVYRVLHVWSAACVECCMCGVLHVWSADPSSLLQAPGLLEWVPFCEMVAAV